MSLTVSSVPISKEQIVEAIQNVKPFPIPIFDLIMDPSKIDTHDNAYISVDITTGTITNAPVINPGSPAYAVDPASRSILHFRPAPLHLSSNIKASELLTLQNLDFSNDALQAKVNKEIVKLRDTMRATRQAMLSQALKGSYAYPMQNSVGAVLTEARSYGSVQDPATLTCYLDGVGADLADLESFWEAGAAAIRAASNNQFGYDPTNLVMLCGADVWPHVHSILVDAYPMNPPKKEVINGALTIKSGDMTFVLAVANYNTFTTKADLLDTPFLTLKTATMIDLSAGHFTRWCAIEDLQAGMRGAEIFVTQEFKSNPSSLEIVAKQTPFVFCDVRAIATDVVLTP